MATEPRAHRRGPARTWVVAAVVLAAAVATVVLVSRPEPSSSDHESSGFLDRMATASSSGRDVGPGGTTTTTADAAPGGDAAGSSAPGPRDAELVGFGAVLATWEARHPPVEGEPGAYGPRIDGKAPQYLVSCCDTRVESYLLVLAPGTTLEQASAAVLAELPLDAVPGAIVEHAACWSQAFTSAAIDAAFGSPTTVLATIYLNDGTDDGLPYVSLTRAEEGGPAEC